MELKQYYYGICGESEQTDRRFRELQEIIARARRRVQGLQNEKNVLKSPA